MARTAKQILDVTPPAVKERSLKMRAVRMGKAIETPNKKLGLTLCEYYTVKGLTDNYKVSLIYLPPSKTKPAVKAKVSPIWVSCNCPYFLYNCEAALTKYGSSSIKYSNGAKPSTTNPRMIPFGCKHVYRAINTSLTTYKDK